MPKGVGLDMPNKPQDRICDEAAFHFRLVLMAAKELLFLMRVI